MTEKFSETNSQKRHFIIYHWKDEVNQLQNVICILITDPDKEFTEVYANVWRHMDVSFIVVINFNWLIYIPSRDKQKYEYKDLLVNQSSDVTMMSSTHQHTCPFVECALKRCVRSCSFVTSSTKLLLLLFGFSTTAVSRMEAENIFRKLR